MSISQFLVPKIAALDNSYEINKILKWLLKSKISFTLVILDRLVPKIVINVIEHFFILRMILEFH